ncbi:hypothetical protein ACPSKX_04780 [Moritella viscosa]
MVYKSICFSLLSSALLVTSKVNAEDVVNIMTENNGMERSAFDTKVAVVPLVISTERLGAALGVSGVIKHAGQPQASIFGLGLYSNNHSNISFISFNNYTLPNVKQWLF